MITITLPEWVAWAIVAWVAFKISDMALGLWIRTANQRLIKKDSAKVDWLLRWAKKNDEISAISATVTSRDPDS